MTRVINDSDPEAVENNHGTSRRGGTEEEGKKEKREGVKDTGLKVKRRQ